MIKNYKQNKITSNGMKKLLSYLIIFIALVAIFGPTIRVNAQTCNMNGYDGSPTGACDYGGTPDYTDFQSTQTECNAQIAAKDAVSFIPDTYGVCTINGSANACWTKTSCIQNKGTFAGYYNLLQPLPGVGATFNPISTPGQPTSLSSYLNPMINIFIGICAVLAVIMILMGGIEYMTSELISSKEAGKERIRNALLGLLLALGAWSILNTINPNLLKSDVSIPDANVTTNITAQNFANSPSTYIVPLGQTGKTSGTNCDENAISTSNQTASSGLNSSQIQTLACIGGIESGCNSVVNYNWNNGSSAYGPFQITLQTNAGCFENSVCQQAAGVSGPLNCAAGFHNGNPIPGSLIVAQCMKAADNFTCSVAAAACLIKQNPNYSDWNANGNLSKCTS